MPIGNKFLVRDCHDHFACHCGYSTGSETGIKLHKRVVHGERYDPDRDDGGGFDFECKICGEVFGNRFKVVAHIRHTGHTKQ